MKSVEDIKQELVKKYIDKEFVIDKTGAKTVEIIGATFKADKDFIIRKPNEDYIKRELEWYESQSLFVDDIPGETPKIWKDVADDFGRINSNYGYLAFSPMNHSQYTNAVEELYENKDTRRAAMIYNRPSIHYEYAANGMNDFICTFANQFFVRDDKLVSHWIMRSNDAIFGYNNDVAWAKYIQKKMAADLDIEVGDLIWTASSLHVYERHFNYLEELSKNMHLDYYWDPDRNK